MKGLPISMQYTIGNDFHELHFIRFGSTDASDIYTSRQAEFFCSKQVTLITDKETQALPPDKIQSKISQMLKNNPKLTEVVCMIIIGYLSILVSLNRSCN